MRTPPDTARALRARSAALEAQLAAAAHAATAQDHTEASLRDALAYVESIVDTVREPLVVLDSAVRVVTASRAFYHMFRVSRDRTEGQCLYELGQGQWNIPALRTRLAAVPAQDTSFRDFEVVHAFPSLGRRVLLLNAQTLWHESNQTGRVLLAMEDITERKRLEEDLVRSNEELQRFAYVAAHDLRSPLNAALTLSELLARRVEGTLDTEGRDILAMVIDNLKRLGALMHDILTYAALGHAPQQRVLGPLEEPLHLALANLHHHITHNGAAIRSGALPTVPADRTQLVMVFQNLIGNALKYRREAPPRIRIDAVQAGHHWQLSVRDNGAGFDPAHAAGIFEPFKRLHGPTVPGSGIGLATCKRIVEGWGGRIWADSIPGEGSTFHFTLPGE